MNLVSILLAAVMCAAAGPGMGVHSEAEPPDWLEPGYVAPVEEDEEPEEPEESLEIFSTEMLSSAVPPPSPRLWPRVVSRTELGAV